MESINLKQLINDYPECITNGAKLKAILLDTYPEISKAIVNTLVIMANSGIAKEIQDSANITELDKSRWQQKLEDEGFSEKVIINCFNLIFDNKSLPNDGSINSNTHSEKIDYSLFKIEKGILIKYIGHDEIVTLPSGIVKIGDHAFYQCHSIKEITIPQGTSAIESSAFDGCISLSKVSLPQNLLSIGEFAFKGCFALKDIQIPHNVSFIGQSAFDGCSSLKEIELPNNINTISDSLFRCCRSIENVIIPNTIQSIGSTAFGYCRMLKKLTFKGTKYEWSRVAIADEWYSWLIDIKQIICTDGIINL